MKDFKLLICCRWFILSATTTVNNCEIPDSSKSACNVFSLVVLRLATQKLSLKWLIDFSTLTLILYVSSHSLEPRSTPDRLGDFFQGKHRSFCRMKKLYMDYHSDRHDDLTCFVGCIPISFWDIRISW